MPNDNSEAICGLCQKGLTARGIGRHLSSCLKKNLYRIADDKKEGPGILHLKVHEGYSGSIYWLYLAVNRDIKLSTLDSFLRKIWLECCGHMSAFFAGSPFGTEELSMNSRIDRHLAPKHGLSYIYDFGSSTTLAIDCVGEYPGKLRKNDKITILSRNEDPQILCDVCQSETAESICHECGMEDGGAYLCSRCLEKHKCGKEMLLPVMNSPRCGVCGYDGS